MCKTSNTVDMCLPPVKLTPYGRTDSNMHIIIIIKWPSTRVTWNQCGSAVTKRVGEREA